MADTTTPPSTEALLAHLVRGLVQRPERVKITCVGRGTEEDAAAWELRVAPEDFPRVVGRGGRTARSLRAVLEYADRGPYRPSLNIVDPEDDGRPV